MATFYPQSMHGKFPPTPPYGMYDNQTWNPPQYHMNTYVRPTFPMRLDTTMKFNHRYAPQASLPPPPPPPPPPPSSAVSEVNYGRASFCGQTLPPISTYHEPMGAPILPRLRLQNNYTSPMEANFYNESSATAEKQKKKRQEEQKKEEQPSGGVSAKLDYEMDCMVDFVAESTQGMYALFLSNICLADIDICRSIQPGAVVDPSFRKWVQQVLTATRLPSATLLLGLHYLTVRLRDFPHSMERSDNEIYRLLTIALILGSKFLDDNTFINRSWSDVTGINVVDINNLEIKWLALIGFGLHVDCGDPNGLSLWSNAWKDYELQSVQASMAVKLSPLKIETQSFDNGYQHANVDQRSRLPLSSIQCDSMFNSAVNTPYMTSDPWNCSNDQTLFDFYNSRTKDLQPRQDWQNHNPFPQIQPFQNWSSWQLPINPMSTTTPASLTYFNAFNNHNNNPWDRFCGYACQCESCYRPSSTSYMMGPSFLPQSVVG